MAIKYVSPEPVRIESSATANARPVPSPLHEAPGGLFPIRFAVHELDEYRMAAGWPVSVPECDIVARTLASADGEVIGYRQRPLDLITDAMVRWVADPDYYDETSLVWRPYQSSLDIVFETGADFAPTMITDYDYRVGTERLYMSAMNFDSDSREHFHANLSGVVGGGSGYTVIMAVNMNSVYGNNLDIPYSGIWCPGFPAPGGQDTFEEPISNGWISITLQGQHVFVESEQTKRVPVLAISEMLSQSAPMYLALVLGRPNTYIYAGTGPSGIRSATTYTGEATPLTGDVLLGRSNGDVLHTADMSVLDLGFYPDRLSAIEVNAEIAKLAAIYGGDQ